MSAEFYKLERCDIGGSKGRVLSTNIAEMYEDYMNFYQKFAGIPYDCTDPEDDSYDQDKEKMVEKVGDMDQRLATMLCEAVDDCHTPESCYKLMLVLGSIIDRPVIKADLEAKYPKYVEMIERDLDHIKVFIFVSLSEHDF